MAKTAVEKLLASKAGVDSVTAGDYVRVSCDVVLVNELSGNRAIDIFGELPVDAPFNSKAVVIVPDHFTPAKDVRAAEICTKVRDFAHKHRTTYFEVGRGGVEHILLPEEGIVKPGEVIIGGDSHTCTYGALGAFATGVGATDIAVAWALGDVWLRVPETIKVELTGELPSNCGGKDVVLKVLSEIGVDGSLYKTLEYTGVGIASLPINARFTVSNMAIESGAKNALFPCDDVALAYLESRGVKESFKSFESDPDAVYASTLKIDLSKLKPLVACPDLPSNVKEASKLNDVFIDQVVIGCCTNGWLKDLHEAAEILKGKTIADSVRLIVVPGTQEIMKKAVADGTISIFLEANAVIAPPGCGPCLGGHLGVLSRGETVLSTTNRNFTGRMGDKDSFIYLSGPKVAAASAIKGFITDQWED
jgi:3-isopropylmalate/(R)-2-methylmalate dehydratase large subunit